MLRRATVWWLDAWFDGASVERYTIEKFHKPIRLGKTGWIVIDDEAGISLATDWAPKEGHNDGQNAYEFRCCCFIPRCMIESVEYLDGDR